MEVDETMITGHLDHARFSGERFGRIINLLIRSHSVFSTAGALELSQRMLPGESRNSTSQERVGCGLKVPPPAGIVHEARESAQGTSACFHLPRASAKGSSNRAGSRRFFPKKVYYGGAPGLESGKIDFYTNSSTYALPFSRTIPVRTPQSASRTEVSRPLCHGRAPLTPGRTVAPWGVAEKNTRSVPELTDGQHPLSF